MAAMQAAPPMTTPPTELRKEERIAIVGHLDACIGILDRHAGRRSVPEIKLRSMLAVLQGEMANGYVRNMAAPPFALQPAERR
jgi:hypothetical protein